MRKMLSLAAIAAAAAPALTVTALPSTASAQVSSYMANPCGLPQQQHRVAGGALGAAAGALIGRSVAARNARTEGTIVGALAGAAVGQEVGRRTGCRAAARQAQAYGGYQQAYAPAQCKAVAGNRYVCLQPDGRWR